MFQKYLEAQRDPDGMRSFVNLYLGLPFKEKGARPQMEKVIELRGGYREGIVPNGVLFLTMFIDVQRGSEKDPNNPPRVEMEICGHGALFRTWSIAYKRFEGPIDDPYDGAWEALNEWAVNGGLSFKRADGKEFQTAIVLIDSGDGMYVDVVYRFTSRWQNTYPSKGFSSLQKRKEEKSDDVGPANFKRYRAARSEKHGDVIFYELATNYYKGHIITI